MVVVASGYSLKSSAGSANHRPVRHSPMPKTKSEKRAAAKPLVIWIAHIPIAEILLAVKEKARPFPLLPLELPSAISRQEKENREADAKLRDVRAAEKRIR